MIDIQHDSPVPVHEQITSQLIAHVASGALPAGARLPEYRAFAQQLLTHPQVVARAYGDLEWDGVLAKSSAGGMEVTPGAALICRTRQQQTARQRLGQAVREGRLRGLSDTEIRTIVEDELAAPSPVPANPEVTGIKKKPTHASGHRTSQGIQVLSRQEGRGSPEPDRPPGGDLRPPRG
jgi:GntR family transcriptional regulator